MKRLGIGWSMVAGTLLLGLVCQAAEADKKEVAGMRKETSTPKPEDLFKVEVLKTAAQLNVFRLSAGFDVDRALDAWATPQFRERWEKEVAIGFKESGTKDQLRDFFSSAVVMIGRCEKGKAVVLLYNPWSDGLLFVAVEPGKENPALVEFQFMAGESWRKEVVKTSEDFLSLYTAKDPLLVAIARKYAAVERRFNQEYPVAGSFEFLPASVKTDAGKNSDELMPIVVRLAYRQRMFAVLKSKDNADAVKVVHDLRQMFKANKMEDITAYLSPKQNAGMLQNVIQMPQAILRNMSPNYFAKDKDDQSGLIAMVNPDVPRWFMAVRMVNSKETGKPGVTLEVFDLALSSKILKDGKAGAQ